MAAAAVARDNNRRKRCSAVGAKDRRYGFGRADRPPTGEDRHENPLRIQHPRISPPRAPPWRQPGFGVPDGDISLLAREDIELQQVPDHLMAGRTDLYPAAARGMACGGGRELLRELIAIAVPPLGATFASAAAMGPAVRRSAAGAVGWSAPTWLM